MTALQGAAFGRGRRLPALPIRSADAWLALAVAVIQVAVAFGIATHHHDGAGAWRPLPVTLLLSGPVALIIRSSYPALSVALVMAGALANGAVVLVEVPLYPSMIGAVVAAVDWLGWQGWPWGMSGPSGSSPRRAGPLSVRGRQSRSGRVAAGAIRGR